VLVIVVASTMDFHEHTEDTQESAEGASQFPNMKLGISPTAFLR
jgi:hypothetical protein